MTKNNGLKKNKIAWLELAFIMLFSVYYILPSVSNSMNILVPITAGLMYIVYITLKDAKAGVKIIGYLFVILFIALAYILLTDTATISKSLEAVKLKQFIATFNQYFCMYLPAVFLYRTVKKANVNQKKLMLAFTFALIIFVIIQTLQELAINPDAIRQWSMFEELDDDNIGNYYFVYSIPILLVAISVCLPNFNKIQVVAAVLSMVFLFYFLLKAQYTLALIITVIGLLVQLFVSLKSDFSKAMLLLAATVGAFFVPNVLEFAYTSVKSEQVSIRLKELYDFFTSGSTGGYNLNGRLTLYGKSALAFLKSPIIGNRHLDFDGHATCLTVLADTGIIGGIPFYYLLISAWKKTKLILNQEGKRYFPVYMCLLLMGFTNPIHTSLPLAITVWYIAPLLINTVYEKRN